MIIDDISMVLYLTLRNINLRLQEIKHNQLHFGGCNIILFGDLMQLPPASKTTSGDYCYRQPLTLIAEVNLWHLFSFCESPQNMRLGHDTTYVEILNNLRVGQLIMQLIMRNLNVNHGLVNGAMGAIRRIKYPALRRDQLERGELPKAVYIEFDEKAIKKKFLEYELESNH
ncbi:unnamed protein product [Euphydryas editha]|uniref:ATP-dependent DNA helicase n=1 Tax=Euphydryas editha TaxID=104508 RepID=A0AAU9V2X9_EUPED|nr:unnamed protein product [Euphydryas editha]